VRGDDARVYQFKTNAIDSLNIKSPQTGSTEATFTSKANITDITNPLAPISLGGNKLMQITMIDKGEPGSSDTIGMTVTDSTGLLYSSSWSGTNTVERVLGGGNLQVRPALVLADSVQANVKAADLTLEQLQPIVEAAKDSWLAKGLSDDQVRALDDFTFQIDNLADTDLGWQGAGVITIDADAAVTVGLSMPRRRMMSSSWLVPQLTRRPRVGSTYCQWSPMRLVTRWDSIMTTATT